MIKIHREGRLIVLLVFIILTSINLLATRILHPVASNILVLLSLVVLVMVLRFFRDPKRKPFLDERSITSPADGKIVAIERVMENEFLHGECIQVSIFMSIHDVHKNFYPLEGEISYVKYHPGKYLLARHPKSSELNERYSVGIASPHGTILVRQIAGYVARRIRCYAKEGRTARQGREMGFIKFGSRLDLFLPPDVKILVEMNQSVMGSLTPIARFK